MTRFVTTQITQIFNDPKILFEFEPMQFFFIKKIRFALKNIGTYILFFSGGKWISTCEINVKVLKSTHTPKASLPLKIFILCRYVCTRRITTYLWCEMAAWPIGHIRNWSGGSSTCFWATNYAQESGAWEMFIHSF